MLSGLFLYWVPAFAGMTVGAGVMVRLGGRVTPRLMSMPSDVLALRTAKGCVV